MAPCSGEGALRMSIQTWTAELKKLTSGIETFTKNEWSWKKSPSDVKFDQDSWSLKKCGYEIYPVLLERKKTHPILNELFARCVDLLKRTEGGIAEQQGCMQQKVNERCPDKNEDKF